MSTKIERYEIDVYFQWLFLFCFKTLYIQVLFINKTLYIHFINKIYLLMKHNIILLCILRSTLKFCSPLI